MKMLLTSACLVALLAACVSAASVSTGNKLIKIGLEKRLKHGELTLENLQEHVTEVRQLMGTDGRAVIPLHNANNIYYYAEMSIGMPGQTFNMSFDTGTSDPWVVSSKLCRKPQWKQFCSLHKTYDSKQSSTHKNRGKKFSILSHSVQGILSQDTMTVGGLRVSNQVFGEVTNFKYDVFKNTESIDGMIGLAYPKGSELRVNPLFNTMIDQKLVDRPVFAFYMNNEIVGGVRIYDEENPPQFEINEAYNDSSSQIISCSCGGGCSELVLGGIDRKHYKGKLVYANVTEKIYYRFNVDNVSFGSKAVIPPISAILFTGTTLMYGPKKYTDVINKAIDGKERGCIYVVDCDKISSFPDITVTVGGVPLVLKPYDYVLKLSSGECISGLVGVDSMNYLALGDPFLRAVYTVYDMGNDRVGFAQAK